MTQRSQTVQSHSQCARKGSVLIFAMVGVIVALIGGSTVLFTASSQHAGAVVTQRDMAVRLATESALNAVIRYLRHHPDWADDASLGLWTQEVTVDDVLVRIEAATPNLADPSVSIQDSSFETQIATLPRPLFNPPMSGVIGGWRATRTALVQTGLTVPHVGTRLSVNATDGAAHAFIAFGASVSGSGRLSQSTGEPLVPNAIYRLSADIQTSGLPPIDSSFGMRVYADGVLVATTEEALVLTDALGDLLQSLLADARALLDQALLPATLLRTLLSGSVSTYTLTFQTPDSVPSGEVRIELFAESVGLVTSVAFDNIAMDATSTEPVTVTASGRIGAAAHQIKARMVPELTGRVAIVRWDEK